MKSRHMVTPLAVMVLLALLAASCQPVVVTTLPTEEPSPTVAPVETEVTIVEYGPTVAGIVFGADTFMQTVQAGMQAAADEVGVGELLLGDSQRDLAQETALIEDFIARGAEVIMITPISADGSVAALKKAKDAGITIVCFNTCVSELGIASAYLVTKNEDLGTTTGVAAAKFITDQLGGKAKIGILNCDQFEGCLPRKEGFLAEMAQLPGVEVVADQPGFMITMAQSAVEAMLQANPDINLLWAANEGGTVGAALTVKDLGLAGQVFVFGTDMNNQMAEMLQSDDNILQSVTAQAPYQMGYDTLQTAMKLLNGETVEDVTITPTAFFGRGMDDLIKQFVESEGKGIFEQ